MSNSVLVRSLKISLGVLLSLVILCSGIYFWLSRDLSKGFDSTISRWSVTIGRSPRPIPGTSTPSGESQAEAAIVGLAVSEEKIIAIEVLNYYLRTGLLPRTASEVKPSNRSWATNYPMARDIDTDPWGHSYGILRTPGGRLLIVSGGPSGGIELAREQQAGLDLQPPGQIYRLGSKIILVSDSLHRPTESARP